MADFYVTIVHRPEMVPKTIEKYFDRTVRITDFEFYVIASEHSSSNSQ